MRHNKIKGKFLTDKQKRAYRLYQDEGTYRDTAKHFEAKESTVRQHVLSAQQKIKEVTEFLDELEES
jgi:DNA-binding CsgD family transcriptional regulator